MMKPSEALTCIYRSVPYTSKPVLPIDPQQVFFAYAGQIRSRGGYLVIVFCEVVNYDGRGGRKRVCSETFTVETEIATLSPEIVDRIRALAVKWGIEEEQR